MTDSKARLETDRAMRDAAKQLVTNDLRHLRGDVEQRGVTSRFALRMREGAEGLADDGADFVRENPGRVGSMAALGISLLFGWLFRDTISDWFERNWHHVEKIADDIVSQSD